MFQNPYGLILAFISKSEYDKKSAQFLPKEPTYLGFQDLTSKKLVFDHSQGSPEDGDMNNYQL